MKKTNIRFVGKHVTGNFYGKLIGSSFNRQGERIIENFELEGVCIDPLFRINLLKQKNMSVVNVKFFLCDPMAKAPTKGSENAAGFDLVAVEAHIGHELDENLLIIGTGVQVEIPIGYYGMLVPRSSIYKKDLILANSVGIIDSDYRGEIKFIFKSLKNPINTVNSTSILGERVGQLLILPLPSTTFTQVYSFDELSNTERGEGGFGSTGSK